MFCLQNRKSEDGSAYFGGWARMAQPITNFAVVEVAKPNIGNDFIYTVGSSSWEVLM